MRIYLGCDHAGFLLKEGIKEYLENKEKEVVDLGTDSLDSVDYPDYGYLVAEKVAKSIDNIGILICATGIGMSIVANKIPGIRAALCHSVELAKLCREHNHANILVLGSKIVDLKTALEIVEVFLNTEGLGDRHLRRIKKIDMIEKKIAKQS